jgi:hypothetical protein
MWVEIGDFIGRIGFPAFVAVWLLVQLKPEIRRLRQSIEANTVVTAKANGMSAKTVAEIIALVTNNSKKRRATDRIVIPEDKDLTSQ